MSKETYVSLVVERVKKYIQLAYKQNKDDKLLREARYIVENNSHGLDQEEMNILWRAIDIAEGK